MSGKHIPPENKEAESTDWSEYKRGFYLLGGRWWQQDPPGVPAAQGGGRGRPTYFLGISAGVRAAQTHHGMTSLPGTWAPRRAPSAGWGGGKGVETQATSVEGQCMVPHSDSA